MTPASDARPLDDEFVGRVHHLHHVEVRDDLRREIAARAAEDGRSLSGTHAKGGSLARPLPRREEAAPRRLSRAGAGDGNDLFRVRPHGGRTELRLKGTALGRRMPVLRRID